MIRKQLRYRLYRIKTAKAGGPGHGQSKSFRERWESEEHFGGWESFAVTWDVSKDGKRAVPKEG